MFSLWLDKLITLRWAEDTMKLQKFFWSDEERKCHTWPLTVNCNNSHPTIKFFVETSSDMFYVKQVKKVTEYGDITYSPPRYFTICPICGTACEIPENEIPEFIRKRIPRRMI